MGENTTIRVVGYAQVNHPPELARAAVSAQCDGAERAAVLQRAADAAARVRASIETLQEAGLVTRWSTGTVRVWSQRPWGHDGAVLPPVYYAAQDFEVEFGQVCEPPGEEAAGLAALGVWLTDIGALDDVTLGGVEWDVSAQCRRQVSEHVWAQAVADAAAKAGVYAKAAGLKLDRLVSLADLDLAGGQGAPTPLLRMAKAAADDGFTVRPEPQVVAAAVDATYRARPKASKKRK